MKLDKSHIDQIEGNIAPPMAFAITIPVDNGVTVYVCASPFQQHLQPGNWPALVTAVAKALQLAEPADPGLEKFKQAVAFSGWPLGLPKDSPEAQPTAEAQNQPVTENRENSK